MMLRLSNFPLKQLRNVLYLQLQVQWKPLAAPVCSFQFRISAASSGTSEHLGSHSKRGTFKPVLLGSNPSEPDECKTPVERFVAVNER